MRLREIREKNNLSQEQVAELLHVKRSTYSVWEIEKNIIPLERLNDFCNLFFCSLDYVLGFSDTKNYPKNKAKLNKNICSSRLKALRKENKLTQSKLAFKLNTDNGVISRYESGQNMILTTFLIEYAIIFEISCDYLVGKIDKPIKILIQKKNLIFS